MQVKEKRLAFEAQKSLVASARASHWTCSPDEKEVPAEREVEERDTLEAVVLLRMVLTIRVHRNDVNTEEVM
jgi:hypothetical protein